MKTVEEIIKRLLSYSFLDFYDQEDHTIRDIQGFEEKLRREIEQLLEELRLEEKHTQECEIDMSYGNQCDCPCKDYNQAVKELNNKIDKLQEGEKGNES